MHDKTQKCLKIRKELLSAISCVTLVVLPPLLPASCLMVRRKTCLFNKGKMRKHSVSLIQERFSLPHEPVFTKSQAKKANRLRKAERRHNMQVGGRGEDTRHKKPA